jgi:aspartokinase-like uncharacterized kinase
MQSNQVLFKVGGKILENPNNLESTISQITQLSKNETLQNIIIIPGGGTYANFVRLLEKDVKLGDDLAHWMAVYSMNFNGIMLGSKFPKFECIEDFNKLQIDRKSLSIFLPYKYLRTQDELPHNWDVTSDSIAHYITYKLHLNSCFLIKDVDGVVDVENKLIKKITTFEFKELKNGKRLANYKGDFDNLKKSKPIDSFLLTLIDQHKIPCYLLNGSAKHRRIIEFFDPTIPDENKIYTKIG